MRLIGILALVLVIFIPLIIVLCTSSEKRITVPTWLGKLTAVLLILVVIGGIGTVIFLLASLA